MTAVNLAICFLPSLFRLTDYLGKPAQVNANADEDYKPMYKSALACLTSMIEHSDFLRAVSEAIINTYFDQVPIESMPVSSPIIACLNTCLVWSQQVTKIVATFVQSCSVQSGV